MESNNQLKHGMNCSGLIPGREDECTCGLRYRIEVQTEQTLKDAWIKRAMEAEMELLAIKSNWDEAEKALQIFYSGACPNCKQTMDTYFSKPI